MEFLLLLGIVGCLAFGAAKLGSQICFSYDFVDRVWRELLAAEIARESVHSTDSGQILFRQTNPTYHVTFCHPAGNQCRSNSANY
jgi:hypothetical protein